MSTKPLRVGIAGCGGITPWTLQQLELHLDDLRVVAIQDPRAAAREALGERFAIPVRQASFDALCSAGIDLVVINSPNDQHCAQVAEAVARGIACLVQKPMAPSLAEARAMVALAAAAKVPLGVVMAERSEPLHHELRDLVRNGFVGEPILIESVLAHDGYLRTPPPQTTGAGIRRASAAVRSPNSPCTASTCSLGSRTGLSCTEVVALRGSGTTVFEDETTAAVARLGPHTLLAVAASWACRGQRWALRGTQGSIVVEPDRVVLRGAFSHSGPLLRYPMPGEEQVLARAPIDARAAATLAQCEVHGRFARFVQGREPNPSPPEDALQDLAVLDAVHRACAGRVPAAVEPVR